ncbi:SDR family NAD(P)-dependent oxidoreductase [Bacillus haynesii]|uniref:SDR family NAD(P)-dependent oxidoreductase n=1 Tax=Bacillus haynesii TaxID=1925021 RepID=UPI001594801C|nr:SDR family NAD(P)-dependent oxidoreductase [Bacillus haynesii]NVB32826.1 SDR family NAD(P)-dependent oxidoreductase [Bacillus licheniformis]MCY7780000.1 SDR family NAD(P)-dependent oxidoreductase [Bacillus haynesii]MEC0669719.1 SDR family NAD(P)-dependent oxidoreductase [Bacillus haynesii]MEC1416623.1 SDR family NAD(P)-dependent oxidoreductase [Bacillus haynesii]MEC1466696.1 SDR family NAD(P)-dependent oxidoreductase [Bacillus haynesii]
MKKAMIIGASSGIGKALAKQLSAGGVEVGLAARRYELLAKLRDDLPGPSYIKKIDTADSERSPILLKELLDEMNWADAVFICSGVGYLESEMDWSKEKETIDVNVTGFVSCSNVLMEHFIKNGRGHLVGISSIAALRGNGGAVTYAASKAFVSNYLKGLRQKVKKLGCDEIVVTEIQPGFVDTALAKGDHLFWTASPEKAAAQIISAVQKKKTHAYITKRWRLISWILKCLP